MNILEQSVSGMDERLRRHISERFHDEWTVRGLSQHFRREGYVRIRDLVPDDVRDAVRAEAEQLLEHARRIDTTLKTTGDTPRRMSTVGYQYVAKHGTLIPAIYDCPAVTAFLSRLAREQVVPCPYEPERIVMTKQERSGDTHGWHWGDFSFAAIWIIEAPEVSAGGMLQCVPHTDWDKSDPRINEYLVTYPTRTYHHVTGDIYLLRTDTTLHRTVPLVRDVTRIILNMAFASRADAERVATHETTDALFE